MRRLRHIIRHSSIIGCILLFLLACANPIPPPAETSNNTSPREHCANQQQGELNEVLIGVTIPLSKPGAAIGGKVMEAAYNIALEEINAADGLLGKPVRLIIKDTKGTPEEGLKAATALITQDCVVAIVGEYHSAVALKTMEVAHQYQIPVIFAETYSDDITAVGYPEVFRIAPASTFTAQMDAKWLAEVGDYNADGTIFAVILAENTDYGVGQVEKAKTWFPEFGISTEIILIDLPADDFTKAVNHIQNLPTTPDAIFIKVTGETSYRLQKQLINAKLAPGLQTILVANQVALDYETYWQQVPEGVYVVVPRIGPWATSVTNVGQRFVQKYQVRFNKWPEPYAFEAYDSLWLIADAIKRAGTLDSKAIITALEETDIELASGRYRFPYGRDNPAGGFIPEFMWHQWPDVPLLFLQYTAPNQPAEEMAVIWPETYRTVAGPIIRPGD